MNKDKNKIEISRILMSKNVDEVTKTLLDITYNYSDWEWVQDECLKLTNSPNYDIAGLAITCLGHLARIHQIIDAKKVIPILLNLRNNENLSGRVEDALDDIKMFTG